LPVSIRLATAGDENFIYHSWLKSLRNQAWSRHIGNDAYYRSMHRLIERLLPRTDTLVVYDVSAPNLICAWLCGERLNEASVAHMAFVKHDFRGMGLLHVLLSALGWERGTPLVYTCDTRRAHAIARKIDSPRSIEGFKAERALERTVLFHPHLVWLRLEEQVHGFEE
jgi:hypothetical protein